MSAKFVGLLNMKYKKINSKVRFVGKDTITSGKVFDRSVLLVSKNYGLLSSFEIESTRRAIRKILGKSKRVRILCRVFPYIPQTSKPAEVRMGKGKGSRIRRWVSFVRPGKVIFQLTNIRVSRGKSILLQVKHKLSIFSNILIVTKVKSKVFKLF